MVRSRPARDQVGLATARGLAAAHAKSIIHRDIKPENLLITKDGRLKILDFGLAKQLPAAPSTESQTTALLSSPGAVMGTPAYMSPEQCAARRSEPAPIFSAWDVCCTRW